MAFRETTQLHGSGSSTSVGLSPNGQFCALIHPVRDAEHHYELRLFEVSRSAEPVVSLRVLDFGAVCGVSNHGETVVTRPDDDSDSAWVLNIFRWDGQQALTHLRDMRCNFDEVGLSPDGDMLVCQPICGEMRVVRVADGQTLWARSFQRVFDLFFRGTYVFVQNYPMGHEFTRYDDIWTTRFDALTGENETVVWKNTPHRVSKYVPGYFLSSSGKTMAFVDCLADDAPPADAVDVADEEYEVDSIDERVRVTVWDTSGQEFSLDLPCVGAWKIPWDTAGFAFTADDSALIVARSDGVWKWTWGAKAFTRLWTTTLSTMSGLALYGIVSNNGETVVIPYAIPDRLIVVREESLAPPPKMGRFVA